MNYQITNNLQSTIYQDAVSLRRTVFINEQNVPEEREIDENESNCWHIVVYDNEKPIATARILPQGVIAKVQRIAVLKEFRGKNIGYELMQLVTQKALLLDASKLKLGAQKQAIPFYAKLGYEVVGDEYMDAGIPHYDMMKKIT